MPQWEYQITIHELPEGQDRKETRTIACDQNGLCFVHDVFQGGMKWLENLFDERGKDGWELVQSGYHNREIFCIWKKRRRVGKKG